MCLTVKMCPKYREKSALTRLLPAVSNKSTWNDTTLRRSPDKKYRSLGIFRYSVFPGVFYISKHATFWVEPGQRFPLHLTSNLPRQLDLISPQFPLISGLFSFFFPWYHPSFVLYYWCRDTTLNTNKSANKKSIENWEKFAASGGGKREHDKKTAAQAPVKTKEYGSGQSALSSETRYSLIRP